MIRGTLILAVGSAASALLSFGLSILIGRATGEAGLGVYAAALAWVFPLSLITEFGLGTLITREVAQSAQAAPAYLRRVAQARLLIGGSLMLCLWLAAPLLSQDARVVQGLRLSAPLIVVLPFYSAFTAVFRAHQQMHYVALLNIGMLLAQAALAAWVFSHGGGVAAALAVNTLTSAGQLVAAWGIYWRVFAPLASSYSADVSPMRLRDLLRQGYPFAVAAVLAALQMRANVILLEAMSGAAAVGYYAVAQRFIEAGRILPMALFDALFPRLAALAAQPAHMRSVFVRVSAGLGGYGAAFALALTLAGAPLIGLTYGAAFVPAVGVLQVTAWALLPLLLKQARTLYWYALKQEQFVNRVTLAALALQVALALALIPPYGALGAAAALLTTEGVALLLLVRAPASRSQMD